VNRLTEFAILASPAPPLAMADTYSTIEGSQLITPAPGVLANDVDPRGNTLTATVVLGPAHGQLALLADGSFTYTPLATYVGPDVFSYTATNGIVASGATTVSIDVRPGADSGDGPPAPGATPELDSITLLAGGLLGRAGFGVARARAGR
jgi:hypothetical protein